MLKGFIICLLFFVWLFTACSVLIATMIWPYNQEMVVMCSVPSALVGLAIGLYRPYQICRLLGFYRLEKATENR